MIALIATSTGGDLTVTLAQALELARKLGVYVSVASVGVQDGNRMPKPPTLVQPTDTIDEVLRRGGWFDQTTAAALDRGECVFTPARTGCALIMRTQSDGWCRACRARRPPRGL